MNYKLKKSKKTALLLAILILGQAVFPSLSYALSGGPSQPEVIGFQPIGASNMVDLFSGDFNYNIPLLDVGGYPINIGYQANPNMDQEASWVGLGWSLTPGAINRTVRGIPDDFDGDKIKKEFNIKDDITVGLGVGFAGELFGFDKLGFQATGGVFYNNKRGPGIETSFSPILSLSKTVKKSSYDSSTTGNTTTDTQTETSTTASANIGLNFNYNSQSGFGIPDIFANFGLSKSIDEIVKTSNQYTLTETDAFNNKKIIYDNHVRVSEIKNQVTPSRGIKGGASLSQFSDFSHVPPSPMPLKNQSYVFNGKLGAEFLGFAPGTTFTGYFMRQSLMRDKIERSAYGYLNMNHSKSIFSTSIQDYNKEKNTPYSKKKPILPISYGTYDLFSVTGQGVSGQYRAMRNDIGILREPSLFNKSSSVSAGAELAGGVIVKGGVNIIPGLTTSETKKWSRNNQMVNKLDFRESGSSDHTTDDFEAVFFKGTGQKLISDNSFYDEIKKNNPIQVDIVKNSLERKIEASSTFKVKYEAPKDIAEPIIRASDSREKRNQLFSYLTTGEIKKLVKEESNSFPQYRSEVEAEIIRKDHHLSEVSITQGDGSRYIYGIPVYNVFKKDVTFNIPKYTTGSDDEPHAVNAADYIHYTHGEDNTVDNSFGKDHYFESEEVPAHAHAYLLTQVLSADYVDKTGDGITEDDLGTAVKFNYDRVHENYRWRMPIEENKARFQDGFKSKKDDDKAGYIYGEKEIFYLTSIESRNMIAEFHTADRDDALGVKGEAGGKDEQLKSQRLESIVLYTKAEYGEGTSAAPNAVPIKTAHFEYDETYPLCSGLPNSVLNKGKLTLSKIYFTYGKSDRGMLNAYKFNYSAENPDYNIQNIDRWGCYKGNENSDSGISNNIIVNNPNYPLPFPPNDEFSYVLQEHQQPGEAPITQSISDKYAEAWNLKSIELPSGGTIDIEYESDDYAYVQDKRAGQMMFVKGITSSIDNIDPNITYNRLYDNYEEGENDKDKKMNKYMILQLPQAINPNLSDIEAKKVLKERYFEDVEKLFFQFATSLTEDENNDNKERYEFIRGYIDYDIDKVQFVNGSRAEIAIEVEPIKIRAHEFHPVTVAALQSMLMNFSELVHGGIQEGDGDPEKLIKGLLGIGSDVANIAKSHYKRSINNSKQWAKRVDLNKSWIRLSNPDFKKEGGGSRVKQVAISDGWNRPGDHESTYGQRYFYTTTHELPTGEEIEISSGVSSYEPLLGNEENLMRLPMDYTSKRALLGTTSRHYIEKPIGESLFPMASVGYSKVKVESFGQYNNIERTGAGYSINEFYTAKDFPIETDWTTIDRDARIRPLGQFLQLNINKQDRLGVSQGFVVEINDMHGKPSFEAIYDNNEQPISSTKYEYRTNESGQVLNNEVDVVDETGTVSTAFLGLEVDVWQEMQQESTFSGESGVKANMDGFLALIFPAAVPTAFPAFSSSHEEFSSSVTTKLIKRFGLLDKVIVEQNGSTITTNNKLYDAETGEVLLTETQNEFNAPIYKFKYPAHWAYDGMQSAYQNINLSYKDVPIVENKIVQTVEQNFDLLFPGDELCIELIVEENVTPVEGKYYVVETFKNPRTLVIMDIAGNPIPDGNYNLKIIRSGHRNMPSYPIASVSSLQDPTEGGSLLVNETKEILNASAVEYKDIWQLNCEERKFKINPYTEGLLGNWRPHKTYTYYSERKGIDIENGEQEQPSIEKDGYYTSFLPFWSRNITNDWLTASTINTEWIATNEITIHDIRGNELENRDAIGNYSAALFGYLDTKPIAIASNAQNRQLLFDSFEQYDLYDSSQSDAYFDKISPFPFAYAIDKISSEAAHTGKKSIKLEYSDVIWVDPHIELYQNCEPYAWQTDGLNEPVTDLTHILTDGVKVNNGCEVCLPSFSPNVGETYVFSAWIASSTSIASGQFSEEGIGIMLNDNIITSEGAIIDGWQRIFGEITVLPEEGNSEFILIYNYGRNPVYMDDVRLHPVNSNMVSYVYDSQSLRLMAQLDDNNYASFYEYDDEGILVRTKRETEKGIATIQESRTVLKPNN